MRVCVCACVCVCARVCVPLGPLSDLVQPLLSLHGPFYDKPEAARVRLYTPVHPLGSGTPTMALIPTMALKASSDTRDVEACSGDTRDVEACSGCDRDVVAVTGCDSGGV